MPWPVPLEFASASGSSHSSFAPARLALYISCLPFAGTDARTESAEPFAVGYAGYGPTGPFKAEPIRGPRGFQCNPGLSPDCHSAFKWSGFENVEKLERKEPTVLRFGKHGLAQDITRNS